MTTPKTYPSRALVQFRQAVNLVSKDVGTPHLVCASSGNQEQWYLVIDGHTILLGNDFMYSFDILFKSFFVFNLQYPNELLLMYNFFDSIIYNLPGTRALPSVLALQQNLIKM